MAGVRFGDMVLVSEKYGTTLEPSSILCQLLAGEPCKREVVFFSEKAEFFSAHLFVNLVQKSSTSLFSLVVEHPLRKGKYTRSVASQFSKATSVN